MRQVKERIVADAMEWLKCLKGRQDPQTKLLRDLTMLASEALGMKEASDVQVVE